MWVGPGTYGGSSMNPASSNVFSRMHIEVFKGEFSMVSITETARKFSLYVYIAIVE